MENKTGLIGVLGGKNPTAGFIADENKTLNSRLINKDGNITGIRIIMADGDSGEFKVKFRDISSSPDDEIISREWNFGDETTSDEAEPEHTYVGSVGDAFDVSLTVQNKEEFDTVTKPAFVSIASSIIPGFIKGKVTDRSTKAVLSKVAIELGLVDKVIASVETTDDGAYFMQVPQGDYTLKAKKEGFKEFIKDVKLKTSVIETLDIELVSEGEPDGGRGGTPEPTPRDGTTFGDVPPVLKLLLLKKLFNPKPVPDGKPPKGGKDNKNKGKGGKNGNDKKK